VANSADPLGAVARDSPALAAAAHGGAAVGAAAALLLVLAALSRTAFAMASHGDLPHALSAVHPRRRAPHRAEAAMAAAAGSLSLLAGPGALVAAGSLFTLVYYGVANAAALTLAPEKRRRPVAWAGLAGCAALALSLPIADVAAGAALLAGGLAVRRVARPNETDAARSSGGAAWRPM
jgi:APA family basic amino acid/polyamine antiporter